MSFEVAPSTLESLEWARITDALRTCCRTPLGAHQIAGRAHPLFASSEAEVRLRLRETSEARELLDQGSEPPLGGCADLESSLGRVERGGVIEATELLDVQRTLETLAATRRFFERQAEHAPTLGSLAGEIETADDLTQQLARSLDPSGEIRDRASRALAAARHDARRLASELQTRIERSLQSPEIAPHLSDQYYTVRNGRFVLPVKADAKGQVRGIVHDASRAGHTLFVEPDGMVELNNRHRQAELAIERETLRVLRELSAAVALRAQPIRQSLAWLARLDLAMARGRLSRDMDAVAPEVGRDGIFELPGLRHPLIPRTDCVANDLRLGADFAALILSGPNAGGKTVALKSIALAALMVRAGLHVPADAPARVDLVDRVLADIGDHQDIAESLSTFSAAMASLAEILRTADRNTLVCLDEIGVGTDPSEGAAIAQATLETLADSGARVVTTTHYNLLKELAELDPRFENASVEFDPQTLAPTYRVRIGTPGASSATTVAARMGVSRRVLDRAAALLDREDRRLDRVLAELAANRALLEAEKSAAQALREESERAREDYRRKLARLQERRDALFDEMRGELDRSFRGAHEEVARIIAELQRAPTSKRAASARDALASLRERTNAEQHAQGLVPATPSPDVSATGPIDWPRARVGDPVQTPGGGRGRLLSLPDRRGRVTVQVAGAKLSLAREQLGAAPATTDPRRDTRATSRASGTRRSDTIDEATREPERLGGRAEVDLRGLRVDEAIDRLDHALDLAAAQGRDELLVIHGIGTGALRKAVRESLPRSVHVIEASQAAREEGGAGATRAILRKD